MALQVNIRKRLEDFTLEAEFEAGREIFAILGASGCGKSMTLRCVAGIETPDEGRIVLDGRVLYDSGARINLPPQKRRVGYMFQDYALFPNMTVEKNIMAGMGRRPDRRKAAEYIRRFRLEGLERRYPAELSGGQKQRVAMARMLASEPDVLLLDEPFSALDGYLRWKLEQEMKALLLEIDRPVLFVSHSRDEVYRLCSRVCCIREGKMEGAWPVKEFFDNPRTETAALLSGCKNISRARVLDVHRIEAVDWGVVLTVDRTEPDIDAVGIRAHYFKPGEGGENCFPVLRSCIQEDPFEWNVSFQTGENTEWLQWKLPKNRGEEPPEIPPALRADPADIMLLRSKVF